MANSGVSRLKCFYEKNYDGQPEELYAYEFFPRYFHPHLNLFSFPEKVPDNITKEINQSFELFFCNPPSAATRIRIALEYLMNCLKVKKTSLSKKGKKVKIVLHERIQLLPKKYGDQRENILALKWLGNAGSHHNEQITEDDVMDAYQVMEEVLNEIFGHLKKQVKTIARQINKKRGPRKT